MTAVDNGVDTWSHVRERLVAYAVTLGVSSHDAQDVAQEAIGRALERDIGYRDAEDLLRWCQRVTHNLVMDEHRYRQRWWTHPVEDGAWGSSVASDVADGVADRDLLMRTLAAVAELPPTQRAAIVGVIDGATAARSRQEQVRSAVARNRARTSLRSLVGYGTGLVAVLVRLGRRIRTGAPAGALAAAAFVAVVVAPDAGTPVPSYGAGSTLAESPAVKQLPVGSPTAALAPARALPSVPSPGSRRSTILRLHQAGLIAAVQSHPTTADRPLACVHVPTLPGVCVK